MRRWRLGEFDFDEDARRLSRSGADIVLEPKSASLLAYFCEHPHRTIDRDELLQSVWHGQVVSDNSINRVIVQIRKALGDDETPRRYIVTVPKVGYRCIAEVAAVSANATQDPSGGSDSRVSLRWPLAIAVLVSLLAAAFLWVPGTRTHQPSAHSTLSVIPLSRLATPQFNADLAGDGEGLLYTARGGDGTTVFLIPAAGADPVPVSEPGGDADYAKWASGGEFVVYRFSTEERCEFHRVDRDALGERRAEVIYECLPGSPTELMLSPDNTTLYFVERANAVAPYAAVALDMQRGVKRRLSQPVASGYGNHYLDVHPQTGGLLLLSDHAPGKTSIYEIDPKTDTFSLLRELDYSLDTAIWSHRDGFVVHPSKHPSYQLLETSLASGVSEVLVSDSRRISSPRRIYGEDAQANYLFTSYLYNRDILLDGMTGSGLNSAVMDYLPALSHDADQLAFVSKRSGDSQLWIKDFRDGGMRAIAPPDTGRRFLDLSWSPDDQHLLANSNSGILIYSFTKEGFVHEISTVLPAYAVHWHDANRLSFSHYEGQRWQAYIYDLSSATVAPLEQRWAFSLRNDEHQLYFDQRLAAYRDGVPLRELEACAPPLWRGQLRYQLDGESIYCHANDAMSDLLRFDGDMDVTRLEDLVARYEFFSVSRGKIATTRVASAYSDIMRTRRPDGRRDG